MGSARSLPWKSWEGATKSTKSHHFNPLRAEEAPGCKARAVSVQLSSIFSSLVPPAPMRGGDKEAPGLGWGDLRVLSQGAHHRRVTRLNFARAGNETSRRMNNNSRFPAFTPTPSPPPWPPAGRTVPASLRRDALPHHPICFIRSRMISL